MVPPLSDDPTGDRWFQPVFDDPHVLIGILDPDGTTRRVNDTALSFVDATEEELRGVPFWETPWWEHSEELQADLREWVSRVAEGEYVEYEADHYTLDGERRTIEGLLRPVRDDGDVVSIVISGRDVTERVREQYRLQVLDRILRHNVRNKVNIIQGYAEEFLAELADAERELTGKARAIIEAADSLDAASTKVHEFGQLSNEDLQSTESLTSLVERVVAAVADRHPSATMHVDLPTTTLDVPSSLEPALAEGLENAVEHHDRANPTVELSATVVADRDSSRVAVAISDDGPGIPRAEFEPVLRGEETPLAHTSGVGLWLIKWVVGRHGGDLSVATGGSRGTTLTLEIPATRPDEVDQVPE